MKLTKEQAKDNLAKLIAKYQSELSADKIKDYNEEATKTGFIMPLLKDVLGWDVNNRDEVSPEENVSRGRVDYGLKINDRIKIYVEAKMPKDGLMSHVEQALKYGYNKKSVPFVLLTNFDDTWLFDVTVKPNLRNPLKGRKSYVKWDQYLDYFDELWLLSKESALNGELDKLLLKKSELAKLPVDKAILADLKHWREILAKDIFKNNPKLFCSGDREKDAVYLKEITQKLLDRIVFMRSCEDRGLVHRQHLNALFEDRTETVGTNTMLFLKNEFESYNRNFDSDLFRPQDWEKDLGIDFTIMEEIIKDSYNPYQFDVIPLEVLGNIYEEYLGDTIRLTDSQVKYEMKLEVRKAGGVYYTPQYIVDYIVKNTIGKLLNELPHNKVKELKILDPACGSGSFLIRAYDEMLNYYRRQKKGKLKSTAGQKKLHQEEELPHLDIFEKRRILIDHIYGVDLDDQAVEVTKLSLMLKMLDGEHGLVAGHAILPMLDGNIKCGNSLVSGDAVELKKFFGDEWYKVKPFNWDKSFAQIMKKGGFDVVIGNPPYGAEFSSIEKEYLQNRYPSFLKTSNSYVVFFELSIKLIQQQGMVGLIIPTTFLTGDNFIKLREILADQNIVQLIKLPYNVFADAYIDTCICIVKKESFRNKIQVASISPKAKIDSAKGIEPLVKWIDKASWLKDEKHNFIISDDLLLVKKRILSNKIIKLEDICEVDRGSLPPNKTCEEKVNGTDVFYWFDGQVYRYVFQEQFSKKVNCESLSELKSTEMFKGERILLRQLISRQFRLNATIVSKVFAFKKNLYCIYKLKSELSMKYILALINSHLFSFYIYNSIAGMQKNDFPALSLADARNLPIRTIDFSNPTEKKLHDKIVGLVDIMLDLNKKLQTAKGNAEEQIQKQIDQTDSEIDGLVYKLYGLTEKEIKIIED